MSPGGYDWQIAVLGVRKGDIYAGSRLLTALKPAVLACPSLSLKAIWSRSLKSAEDSAKLIPGDHSSVDLYSTESGPGKSYDDVLKRDDIAGVILALPIMDQPGYIEKALAAGKHVLAEKPIAPDVASAQKLIAYYKKGSAKTHATLAIAENFRFNQGWAYGAEEIKKLGKVTGFVVRLNWNMGLDSKWVQTSWRVRNRRFLTCASKIADPSVAG
jgi:predicted dehydrogenase